MSLRPLCSNSLRMTLLLSIHVELQTPSYVSRKSLQCFMCEPILPFEAGAGPCMCTGTPSV